MRKFLILTTSAPTLKWPSLKTKLVEITSALRVWEVSIEHEPVVPQVLNGRVVHSWLQNLITPYFNKGHDVVALHMSDAQRKAWKIKPSLRGANPITGNEYGDFYFWADENTKREGLNQFVQTCLHEFGHEYHQKTGKQDLVHLIHDLTPDIVPYIRSLDWSVYQPERSRLRRIIASLRDKIKALMSTKIVHPVPAAYRTVSQPYGVANSAWYPTTGRHIGTDFPTPVGTPLVAPLDCTVTRAGYMPKSLGYWCEVDMGGWYMILCHLRDKPAPGVYKQGATIAYAGKTGFVKGVHTHIEGWTEPMNRSTLNKSNWNTLTFDVMTKLK